MAEDRTACSTPPIDSSPGGPGAQSALGEKRDNYRYTLYRQWIGTGGTVNFIMLNPSTATDVFDDPTIRKCIGFAKRWGFRRLVVTNLFAFRATDPRELKSCSPALAIGPDNDFEAIAREAAGADCIVCAWGLHGSWLGRDSHVMDVVLRGKTLGCIGRTRDGAPLHPSRAAYTSAPELYRLGEARASAAPKATVALAAENNRPDNGQSNPQAFAGEDDA